MVEKRGCPDFAEEKRLWKKGYKFVIGVDEVGRGAFAGPVTVAAVCFSSDKNLKNVRAENITNVNGRLYLRAGRNSEHYFAPAKQSLLERYLKEIGVNDSKVLRPRTREELVKKIRRLALAYSVTQVSVAVINKIGIGKATAAAMRKAIAALNTKPQMLTSGVSLRKPKTKENSHSLELDNLKFSSSKTYVLVDTFHIKYLRGIGLSHQKAIKKGDKKSLSIAAASILAKVYRDRLMKRLSRRHPKYRWGKNKGYGTKGQRCAILRYGLTAQHRKIFVKTFLEKCKSKEYNHASKI